MAKRLAPAVRYWLRSAREDLAAAQTLLGGRHYRQAAFCCHLAVEKALKSVWQSRNGMFPPRVHDLRMLVAQLGVDPPPHMARFFGRIAGLSVPARYPGPLTGAPLGLRRASVERMVSLTKEALAWCRSAC